ncbi:MAG TPA: twitching motility protein PilT, partial [Lacipirellulaceae bacterium]|nr:twitching motility protein PilT [Lacipirellulaceae bacterium]
MAKANEEAFKSSFIHRKADLEVDKLFRACVLLKASDLHLKVDKPPMVRINGTLRPMNREPITDEEMVRITFPLMNDRNRKIFEKDGGADFAHTLDVEGTIWRFRVNLLQQLGHVGMVARRVNSVVPDFKGLFLPPVIEKLCHFDQGMVLLAGVT